MKKHCLEVPGNGTHTAQLNGEKRTKPTGRHMARPDRATCYGRLCLFRPFFVVLAEFWHGVPVPPSTTWHFSDSRIKPRARAVLGDA